MNSVSGEQNNYKFDLQYIGAGSGLIKYIWMFTDRTTIANNYITLGVDHEYSLMDMQHEVNTRFSHLGGKLITGWFSPFDEPVEKGRAVTNQEFPNYIKIANYLDARRVITNLFEHNEMSNGERAGMESALRELEKSAQFANRSRDVISPAQRDLIQEMVAPYIDDIKNNAPDVKTAKMWVRAMSIEIKIFSHISVESFSYFFRHKFRVFPHADFYESLYVVSKFYSSQAGLEGALEQLGEGLPSKTLVHETILALFDNENH